MFVMFRTLTENFLVAPQIGLDEVAAAKEQGVALIINNRPDGEEPSAPQSDVIEAAARDAGIAYVAIPVTHAGFSAPQIDMMTAALAQAGDGKTLAYCRSGTRSTFLWALASAKTGMHPGEITSRAESAGYDVSSVAMMLDALAAQAKS
jgi:uncharacterized protein (TIGR01244 family)